MKCIKKSRLFFVITILSSLAAYPVVGEIYKWTDVEGNVHFSDKKSATNNATQIRLKSSNRYNSSSVPKFEYTPRTRKSKGSRQGRLPKLRPRQVIMYSTLWCGYCKKAKAYFNKKSIAFSERDIEKSAKAKQEYQNLGGGGIPLILVGNRAGTKKISGFSVDRFDKIYNR